MTKVIMVGAGGSTDSTAAVRWAIDRAAAFGAILRMVRVVPAREGGKPDDRHRPPGEDGTQRTEDTVKLLTRTPHDGNRQAVTVEHEQVQGQPGPILARLSRDTDLLVIGSPQQEPEQAPPERPGSTTRYLMRRAQSPVAVIRRPDVRAEPRQESHEVYRGSRTGSRPMEPSARRLDDNEFGAQAVRQHSQGIRDARGIPANWSSGDHPWTLPQGQVLHEPLLESRPARARARRAART